MTPWSLPPVARRCHVTLAGPRRARPSPAPPLGARHHRHNLSARHLRGSASSISRRVPGCTPGLRDGVAVATGDVTGNCCSLGGGVSATGGRAGRVARRRNASSRCFISVRWEPGGNRCYNELQTVCVGALFSRLCVEKVSHG